MTKPKNPSSFTVQDKPNSTQRKSLGLGVYTGPRVRNENEAMPREPTPGLGIKTLENTDTHYRNGGNKQIESRGDKC